MKKSELVNLLNNRYPFIKKEEWDVCGPTPQNFKDEVIKGIFVSLDMNMDTYEKAIKQNCNVIITHHPILLINDMNVVDKNNMKLIKKLEKNNILNIALHTCFDGDKTGTSYQIYNVLKNTLKLDKPKYFKNIPYLLEAKLKTKMSLNNLVDLIKSTKNEYIHDVKYLNKQEHMTIKSICIGAGSCASYIPNVINNKNTCFLTGDVKWHNYLDAFNNDLVVVDIGHEAERVFIDEIIDFLNKKNHKLKLIHDFDFLQIKVK